MISNFIIMIKRSKHSIALSNKFYILNLKIEGILENNFCGISIYRLKLLAAKWSERSILFCSSHRDLRIDNAKKHEAHRSATAWESRNSLGWKGEEEGVH